MDLEQKTFDDTDPRRGFVTNQAILVVRVGDNFFEVFVFGRQAQAIQITAAQAAFLQQFGVPIVVLT